MKTQAAKKNFLAYLLSFGANAGVTLVSSPILLAGLGEVYYGIWKTLQKLFDIASVADGRSGQTLKMIVARSANDVTQKNQAIAAAVIIWLIYLPFAIIMMASFYFLLPLLTGEEFKSTPSITYLFFCFALNFLLAPLITIPDAVLMGSNLGYKSVWIQVGGMIFTTLLSVLSVYLGWGLDGIGGATILSSLVVAGFMLRLTKKTFTWLRRVQPSKKAVNTQLGKTLQMNLWLLIEKLILSGDAIIVASFLGATAAASFSFMTYAPQLALAILLIVCSSLTPGIASMIKDDSIKAKVIINITRKIIHVGAVVVTVLYIYANEFFVRSWVGESMLPTDWSNIAIGFGLFLTAIIRCEAQLQDLQLDLSRRIAHGVLGFFISLGAVFLCKKIDLLRMDFLIGSILLGRMYTTLAYIAITSKLHSITVANSFRILTALIVIVLFYVFLKNSQIGSGAISLIGLIIVLPISYFLLGFESIKYVTLKVKAKNI